MKLMVGARRYTPALALSPSPGRLTEMLRDIAIDVKVLIAPGKASGNDAPSRTDGNAEVSR